MPTNFKQITTHGSDACLLKLLCRFLACSIHAIYACSDDRALVHRLILQVFLLYMTYGWTNIQAGVFGFYLLHRQRIVSLFVGVESRIKNMFEIVFEK